MNYAVKLHPHVERFLHRCERELSLRLRRKFKLLERDPFLFLEHYSGQDFHKLRIGDYRALVDVDQERKIVFVRYLDHRKRIYQRFRQKED